MQLHILSVSDKVGEPAIVVVTQTVGVGDAGMLERAYSDTVCVLYGLRLQ